ncbi:glycoside hydrolase family 5 protein [Rickenella mellea]|uniref:Glycoside hydrolase family 5 protein n=1 Tax=Rickenella mellea TaxID=50990 RepID=A0A4Y7QG79_9AGAM|nr:glycoside hydrolase family 5 protein [Rickenella mellea]
MLQFGSLSVVLSLLASTAFSVTYQYSDLGFGTKIYGVNLGSWLVLEPWMVPNEWLSMGGQSCSDCSTCIASEFAFAKAYPNTADSKFNQHWSSWFAQSDVDQLVGLGINAVRIPLGYWLVEPLVNRASEFYPRGGMKQLKRGLRQLNAAGIGAILDHHALPGVQDPGQSFTGRCTQDVEFYTDYNYHRALIWSAVMTALSHLDPDFSNVFAIEAVNEPIMNSAQTPGLSTFYSNFVQVVRTVEAALGITNGNGLSAYNANVTAALTSAMTMSGVNAEVASVIKDAIPMLQFAVTQTGVQSVLTSGTRPNRSPLTTMFMDRNWQYGNSPANPADSANGKALYDNHLYYSFGGVAAANPQAYMQSICNLNRVQSDAAYNNSPLIFGEWGLPTQFSATDSFLSMWADAQKLAYSQSGGWLFWNFKFEMSAAAGSYPRQWSYFEGVNRGYLTKDPSVLNNPDVCAPYIANSTSK